jgi:glycosyltransferase involved in cell wall biosynthesis
MGLYIDLSEFLKNPATTGIQRIAGELCRWMPANTAVPVRHYRGNYVAFPSDLVRVVSDYFREPSEDQAQNIRHLGACEKGRHLTLRDEDVVLVPEVIIEADRLDFLSAMPEQRFQLHRFLVYDLLPLTHPQFFWSTWMTEICRYYKLLRKSSHCSFISEATRDVFYRRLKRSADTDGVVMPLGADSLGPRIENPALNRAPVFTVLGTIEPRKNHQLILEAFDPLLGKLPSLILRFIGNIGWVGADFGDKIQRLASDPESGFRLEQGCSDQDVNQFVRESRATIYVSEAEGFGLPPLESLWAGTPVIASSAIPSLRSREPKGIHVVEPLTADKLRDAVLAFTDDDYANRKTTEAWETELPTWKHFTENMLLWCK